MGVRKRIDIVVVYMYYYSVSFVVNIINYNVNRLNKFYNMYVYVYICKCDVFY